MKKIFMTVLCAMFFTFGIAFSANALTIDASNYQIDMDDDTFNGTYEYYTGTVTDASLSWWYGFQTGVGDSDSNNYSQHYSPAIRDITGDSEELYKSDHDEGNTIGVDSGYFAISYETTFDEHDPNDATIAFTGGSHINGATHILVKDGNHDPSWYLFNIFDDWPSEAEEDIILTNFWIDGGGGISHVSLYGSNSVAQTPEPATMLLFGTGLIGLASVGRRQLQRRKDA